MPRSLEAWLADAPTLDTNADVVAHTYRRSLVDLAALRFRPLPDLSWSLPAAGLPWFMALFGRDSLITAYMALPFQPHLAATTLEALTEFQATERDDFRDADPGKIVHEVRRGWLATLDETPHSAYHGSHDATPLFLILLDEYERWTGDPDGDGFLEYETRSPKVVTISTDNLLETNEMRHALGAAWPFLADPGRVVQKDLDIAEYTDPTHDPMIPYTFVLGPGLRIFSIYNGYWYWGRPSNEDLRRDLREVTRSIRPDWDLGASGLRGKWEQGQRDDDFWPYGRSMREVLATREA